ncbi:ketosynthase [Streptomyces sp. NBRC 110035]|uniref:ketosynthase n=1 Tax=Streptomyces sp. NBRC 110035 TaxID=1547867 RepID=UPI0006974247|nr:ketosynthase [Streptomyces sp. NBRC 110035]
MTTAASLVAPHLSVVATVVRTPWGDAAEGLPGATDVALPKVRGFVGSRFGPLVHAVGTACLGEPEAFAGADGSGSRRTGIVLATMFGDTVTADTFTQRVIAGQVHSPLLFLQSVPTSILGHLTKQYGITGPLNCVSGGTDLAVEALRLADVLMGSGDVDQVLVVGVESAPNERVGWVTASLAGEASFGGLPANDVAVGLLLRRSGQDDGLSRLPAVTSDIFPLGGTEIPPEWAAAFGWLAPLVVLCETYGNAAL